MRHGFAIAGAALTALAAGLASWQYPTAARADGRGGSDHKPPFVVDADWPKPLPNNWLLGQVAGIAVDRHDNIWIVQRPSTLTADERGSDPVPNNPRRSDCCNRRTVGDGVQPRRHCSRAWGGPADPGFLTARCTPAMGCEWPTNEHGIYVDHNDYVYIAGNGGGNHQVLKFTKNGTSSSRSARPASPAAATPPTAARTERRCWASRPTWKSIRTPTSSTSPTATRTSACWWSMPPPACTSATGAPTAIRRTTRRPGPYDPARRRSRTSATRCTACASPKTAWSTSATASTTATRCSPSTARFVEEVFLERDTLGNGAVWDIDLSPDRRQRYLYNADGENNVRVDPQPPQRRPAEQVRPQRPQRRPVPLGAQPGRRFAGNIYTAEVDTGKRAQKFVPRGKDGRDRDD